MEKPAVYKRIFFRNRLLTSLLLSFCFLFAAWGEESGDFNAKTYRLESLSKPCYVNSDCAFAVKINGVSPENVHSIKIDLPKDVSLVSLKKEAFIEGNKEAGTRLAVILKFLAAGIYALHPLSVSIGSGPCELIFESVNVLENPDFLMPRLIVKFEKESLCVPLGDDIFFSVYVEDAAQILDFNWELQKNALLENLTKDAIDMKEIYGKDIHGEPIMMSKFEWQPLLAGEWKLPCVSVTALSYAGSKIVLSMPDYSIIVLDVPAPKEKANAAEEKAAFNENTAQVAIDCEMLTCLRKKELHSLPYSKSAKERAKLEEQYGLLNTASEHSIPLFYIELSATALFLLLFILSFLKHFAKAGALLLLCCFIVASLSAIQVTRLLSLYGVHTGGIIRTVPDMSSSVAAHISPGVRVRILDKTSQWQYIETGGIKGWTEASCVLLITK